MRILVQLALRNLWRNRRRTLITVSALALGIALLVSANSLSMGFARVGFENLVDYETGELQVYAPGYFDERDDLPLEPLLPAAPALRAARAADGVAAATPRVKTRARLHMGWEEFPVVAVGIDPETDGTVFRTGDQVEGRMPGPGAPEAAVGITLANLLEIRPGDTVLLITRTRHDAFQATDLEVVGLLSTPSPAVNQGYVYVPLDVLDAELDLDGHVTEVALRVEDGLSLQAAVKRVEAALAAAGVAAEAFRWEDGAEDLVAMMQADAVSNALISGVILVIALVGVTNTILLGTLERRQEIGIMKAMGLRERQITLLFLLEATGIAVIAVVVGSLIGAIVNLYLIRVGFDLSAMVGEVDWGIPVTGRVYGVWNPAVFLWAAAAGMIACWIAAYWPARRAARMNAATAVRP